MRFREISSIKTAVPKLGSSVEFPLWKRRFEGFDLAKDCMQAFTTTIDMPVGDPSRTSRFVHDQGFSEAIVRRARIAWSCLTESITDRELLSMVFNTNSPREGGVCCAIGFCPTPSQENRNGNASSTIWS